MSYAIIATGLLTLLLLDAAVTIGAVNFIRAGSGDEEDGEDE